MMRAFLIAAFAVLAEVIFAPRFACAAGPEPVVVVSILAGRDVAGCGSEAFPCKTALFARTRVAPPGARILVQDVGRFGEPDFFTALTIAVENIARLMR